jgi:hypothetical protein
VNGAGTSNVDFELRFKLFASGFEAGDANSWTDIVE